MLLDTKRRARRGALGVAVVAASLVAPLAGTASAAVAPAPNLKSAAGGPTTGHMTVKWGVPPTSAKVTAYRASSSTNGVSWTAPATVATGSQTSASVPCAAAQSSGNGCFFRVYAVNASGTSSASNVVFGKWTIPSKPQNVRANAGPLAGKATINYAAPANNGGLTIDQYRFEYSLDGVSWTLGSATGGGSGTMVVSWCGVGVPTCQFRLRAHNAVGISLPSAPWTATFDVPAAVQTLSSTAAPASLATGSSTVTVSWNAPDTNGLGIDKYEMQFCPGFGTCEDTDVFWATAPTVQLGNVLSTTTTCPVDVTTCAYQIRAHNALGWGPWRHQFLRPYEPTNFDAITGSSPGSVDLQWTAPLDGGAGNLQYQVYRCLTAAGCNNSANWSKLALAPGNALTVTDSTCGFGTSCTYRIAVKDGSGNQSLLTSTKTATGSLFAGPPQNLTATTAATVVGRVDLAWSAASAPPGLPVTNYQISRLVGAGPLTLIHTTPNASTFAYADNGCGAAVVCLYLVQALNGTGAGVGAIAAAVGAGPPSAPQSVTAVPGTTLGGVTVSWTAPATDGGHAVQSYTVQRTSPSNATVGTTAGSTLADPTCGAAVTCQYTVFATNSIGNGTASAAVAGVGTNVPGVPTNLVAAQATTKGAVKLTWSVPASNGGRAILGYAIDRFNGISWDFVGTGLPNPTAPNFTDVTCGPGSLCTYRVRAVNVAGPGGASGVSSATGAIQSTIVHSSRSAVNVQGTWVPLAGDFTADGQTDVLWYTPGSGTDVMFVAAGNGNFVTGPAVSVSGVYTPYVGDFDGVNGDDILWYAPGTGKDAVWLSNGNGTFHNAPAINVNGRYRVLVGDYNADGRDDVFWYAPGTGGDALWLATGGGSFSPGPKLNVNGTYSAFVGDFDGNGRSDIFWYAPGTAADALWLFTGNAGHVNGPRVNVNGTFKPFVGDFDGDHRSDIFWYAPGTAADSLWIASVGGNFGRAPAVNVSGSYRPVVGDFDGNGKSDIDWYSATASDALWLFL